MYGEYCVNVNVEPQSTLTFMHVFHTLPFFNARKIYVCTHVKIAQQWKSTPRDYKGTERASLIYTLFHR